MKKRFLNSSMKIITSNKDYNQDQIDTIMYGLEAIYLTVTKMVVVFGIAYILGIFREVIFLLITYNIIRSQAFGIHASKSSYCLISSLITFIGGALICKYLVISRIVMIGIAVVCCICLLLYAPADTYKRPLINAKKRKRFKLLSFTLGVVYTILIIVFNQSYISNYLLVGMIIAVLMILPITYKTFNLPYDNYKNYDFGV